MQNRPKKCLMVFLIENKTFLTLQTKIKLNPQILVISGKKKNGFSRLYKQSDKKVEKVKFFQRGWSWFNWLKF